MRRFKIVINNERGWVEYDIIESRHDDTSVFAAIEALQTFARHGHSRFPFNDLDLTIKVKAVRGR